MFGVDSPFQVDSASFTVVAEPETTSGSLPAVVVRWIAWIPSKHRIPGNSTQDLDRHLSVGNLRT